MTKKPTRVISINGRKAATLAPAGLPKLTRTQFAVPVNGPITNASCPTPRRATHGHGWLRRRGGDMHSEQDARIAGLIDERRKAISKAAL